MIGIVVTYFTKPKSPEDIAGLTYDTSTHFAKIRGNNPMEVYATPTTYLAAHILSNATLEMTSDGLPLVSVSKRLADDLGAVPGDRLLISDHRWWFGGLRSTQIEVSDVNAQAEAPDLGLNAAIAQRIRASSNAGVVVERLL